MSKAIQLRLETPSEHRAVEELARDAFWDSMDTHCDVHFLTHVLRKDASFVPELDYVAVAEGKIVGHIIYSRAQVLSPEGERHEVITFGPLSVHPEHQGQGIGAALVRKTVAEAERLGYRAIVIFGHPDYYVRFGFRPAQAYGITTGEGKSFDAFMALPLFEGALEGVQGCYEENPLFTSDEALVRAFDADFPAKASRKPAPVQALLKQLRPEAGAALTQRGIADMATFARLSARELAALPGMDEAAFATINAALQAHGQPLKTKPTEKG